MRRARASTIRRCGLWGDTHGTSAVEFALVAPVLFLLLFGIVTFGIHYCARVGLTYAASEGGRAAVAGLTDAERADLARGAVQRALTTLWPLVDASRASVAVSTANAEIGEVVSISIDYSDPRFAQMPFMPDLSNLPPVRVDYYVTDPSG